jgi:hypothetical protein
MTEVLEVFHLPEQDGVAEVQIGRGRIETGFDAERPIRFRSRQEALAQLFLADNLGEPLLYICELFFDRRK